MVFSQEELTDISSLKTDKISCHGYLARYLRLAEEMTDVAAVCEVGVAGGESLRLWQYLFPDAVVVGVDHDPESLWPPRSHCVLLGQDDPYLYIRLRDLSPLGYDLIIDDGSHCGNLSAATFKMLWPLVKSGGYYVLEDWQVGQPHWSPNHTYDPGMLVVARSFIDYIEPEGNAECIEYRHGMVLVKKHEAGAVST